MSRSKWNSLLNGLIDVRLCETNKMMNRINILTRNTLTQASKNGRNSYLFPQKKSVSVFYAKNIYYYNSNLIQSAGSRQVDRQGSLDLVIRACQRVIVIMIKLLYTLSNVVENFEIDIWDQLFNVYLQKKNIFKKTLR